MVQPLLKLTFFAPLQFYTVTEKWAALITANLTIQVVLAALAALSDLKANVGVFGEGMIVFFGWRCFVPSVMAFVTHAHQKMSNREKVGRSIAILSLQCAHRIIADKSRCNI